MNEITRIRGITLHDSVYQVLKDLKDKYTEEKLKVNKESRPCSFSETVWKLILSSKDVTVHES